MVAERSLCLYGVYKFIEKCGLRKYTHYKTVYNTMPKGTDLYNNNLVPKATNINSIEDQRHKRLAWDGEIREKFWRLEGELIL